MRHARPVTTSSAPAPSGAYSQAVVATPFVFLAGQGPFSPGTGALVDGDTEVQVKAVLENLEAVAQAAGGSLRDAVRFGVFLRDLDDIGVVNRVFEDVLEPPFPARTTVQSHLTRFRVEVDAVLYLPDLA